VDFKSASTDFGFGDLKMRLDPEGGQTLIAIKIQIKNNPGGVEYLLMNSTLPDLPKFADSIKNLHFYSI
jgi:hypothetical protein